MSSQKAALIWSPFADRDTAKNVATTLVEEQLVACANIFPAIDSIFRWNGSVQSSAEVGVLFKTDSSRLANAVRRLGQLHPYDTPVIMGWHVDSAPKATLAWLEEAMAQGNQQ